VTSPAGAGRGLGTQRPSYPRMLSSHSGDLPYPPMSVPCLRVAHPADWLRLAAALRPFVVCEEPLLNSSASATIRAGADRPNSDDPPNVVKDLTAPGREYLMLPPSSSRALEPIRAPPLTPTTHGAQSPDLPLIPVPPPWCLGAPSRVSRLIAGFPSTSHQRMRPELDPGAAELRRRADSAPAHRPVHTRAL
jgi:hypothetical protein